MNYSHASSLNPSHRETRKRRKSCKQYRRATGITLIELIVTLSLIAVLTTSAIPSFTSLIRANQLNNQTTALTRALHYARSQALTLSESVLVCPMNSTMSCATQNKKRWTQGWLVAVDKNRNRDFDQQDKKLRLFQNQGDTIDIFSNRTSVAVFSRDGDASGTNRTFTLCHKYNNVVARKVVLSNSGRHRLVVPNSTSAQESCAL